jgi:hypothetical protein
MEGARWSGPGSVPFCFLVPIVTLGQRFRWFYIGVIPDGNALNACAFLYECRCRWTAISGQNSRRTLAKASRPMAQPNFTASAPALRSEAG